MRRRPSPGRDARSEARTQGAPIAEAIGATEDAASGRAARPGDSADASPRRTKLVAVLGYSAWRGEGLHPICAARLAAAEQPAEGAELVLFSGWSRRRHRPSEAELMKAAWRGPAVRLVADGDARTTAGNARAVAAAARHIGADEVVIVTSSWHARRARLLVQAALDPDVRLLVATPGRTRPPHLIGRELAWLPVSLVSRGLARRRR